MFTGKRGQGFLHCLWLGTLWCYTSGAQSWNVLCASWGAIWLWTVGASRKCSRSNTCVAGAVCSLGLKWQALGSGDLKNLQLSEGKCPESSISINCVVCPQSAVGRVGACGCCWYRVVRGQTLSWCKLGLCSLQQIFLVQSLNSRALLALSAHQGGDTNVESVALGGGFGGSGGGGRCP